MINMGNLVMQIHMTFLSHKDSVEWLESFKDEIAPLKYSDFEKLIKELETINGEEQANYSSSLMQHNIPTEIQNKAANVSNFTMLIEHLKLNYMKWTQEA